jgi:hypothetical protein
VAMTAVPLLYENHYLIKFNAPISIQHEYFMRGPNETGIAAIETESRAFFIVIQMEKKTPPVNHIPKDHLFITHTLN